MSSPATTTATTRAITPAIRASRKPSLSMMSVDRAIVWINGAVPGVLLLWDAWHHQLGANPVNFAIRTTGLLSLIFLVGCLVITPLRQLTGWVSLYPHRRTLGLYAAIYAFAHFGIFFWWDREGSVSSTLHEIRTRQYIWYGLIALIIFIPLTVTSTQGMIRRLGPTDWRRLHRLVYVAAIGGAVHYLLLNKIVTTQSIVFACVIGALLVYREIASNVVAHIALKKQKAALEHGQPVLKPKFWKGKLRVIGTIDETPEVRTFQLAAIDGSNELPFDYKPGQYLNLMLSVNGKPVNRSYTIASSPSRPSHCELTVKREEMGESSKHLHTSVQVGDELAVSAPAGKFIFDGKTADSIVFVAGGVGITPLMSKVRYLTDTAWPGEMYFIMSARTASDIIFRDELNYLAGRHPKLHVVVTLTRPDDHWAGERGRVSIELLNRVVPDLKRRLVHICGPTEMADATRALLLNAGVPEAKIETESFTPAGRRMAGDSAAAPTQISSPAETESDISQSVSFEKSGKTAESAPGQTILEVAESAGVAIPFDCRSGICGTCKVRLISGQVAMDIEDALTASDRNSGIVLACQAKCASDVTIDA